MSLYAMADFHLSKGVTNKPMDIFGNKWNNYMEKIEENCNNLLKNDDVLLIAGDISWATYLPDALPDLQFIEQLPGQKIISKGNHDYWWSGISKLNSFLKQNNLNTISFLHNNYFVYNGVAICGNRGWTLGGTDEDIKIYKRELLRLELSLSAAEKAGLIRKIVMTHFPPFVSSAEPDGIIHEMFKAYNVETCVYGHLHNISKNSYIDEDFDDIQYKLTSADYLGFMPYKIL